jgi:hypothetical protein
LRIEAARFEKLKDKGILFPFLTIGRRGSARSERLNRRHAELGQRSPITKPQMQLEPTSLTVHRTG